MIVATGVPRARSWSGASTTTRSRSARRDAMRSIAARLHRSHRATVADLPSPVGYRATPDSVKDRRVSRPRARTHRVQGRGSARSRTCSTPCAMQRLRRIKQMGFAWLVYPGAEHSRFGHALGAFHIAQQVTRRLELDAADVALHVKVAALLHDVGHGPFSHAWEHVFAGHDHERWGARIVAEDRRAARRARGARARPARDAAHVLGQGLPAALRAQARVARSSTSIGSTTSCATATTRAPATRPTTSTGSSTRSRSRTSHRHDDPSDLVVDYRRGMYAVEQYLFARSYMYAQVYHHKTVRAAEWMFIKTLERFAQLARQRRRAAGPRRSPAAWRAARRRGRRLPAPARRLGDDRARSLGRHRRRPGADDPVLRDLATRLVRRRLFKTFDLGDDRAAAERLWPQALEVATSISAPTRAVYVHLDTARHAGTSPPTTRSST